MITVSRTKLLLLLSWRLSGRRLNSRRGRIKIHEWRLGTSGWWHASWRMRHSHVVVGWEIGEEHRRLRSSNREWHYWIIVVDGKRNNRSRRNLHLNADILHLH